jgi:hypothetical protein
LYDWRAGPLAQKRKQQKNRNGKEGSFVVQKKAGLLQNQNTAIHL